MKKKKKHIALVLILLVLATLIAIIPLFLQKGAAFGGSDDAGSRMVGEITGTEYTPWFTPMLETAIGGELSGEVESLLFCIQTGIGTAIISYGFGYWVARKKYKAVAHSESSEHPHSSQLD